MKKRLLIFLPLILLVVLLFSCQKKSEPTEKPETTPGTTGTAPVTVTYEIPKKKKTPVNGVCCLSYFVAGEQRTVRSALVKNVMTLYLPESVDQSNLALFLTAPDGYDTYFNGKNVTGKIVFWNAAENPEAKFGSRKGAALGKSYPIKIVTVKGPIVLLDIDDERGELSETLADKEKETFCFGTLSVDGEREIDDFVAPFSANGHGNATFGNEKKALNVRLYAEDACENKAKYSVLGMDYRSDWTLLATQNDYTMCRTAFCFDMGRKIGLEGTLHCEFAQVFFDGAYNGLYLVTEKQKDVLKGLGLKAAESDTLDASYCLELDNSPDKNSPYYFKTEKGMKITIHTQIEGCKYEKLKAFINSAERAMHNKDGVDPKTNKKLSDLIDLESFAKFLLVRDFSFDYDAMTSMWFYFDATDQKLHAGPLWDFDNSLGRHDSTPFALDTTTCTTTCKERGTDDCWLRVLFGNSVFRKALDEVMEEYADLFERDNPDGFCALWDSFYDRVRAPADLNLLRWPTHIKDPPKTEKFPYDTYDNSKFGKYFGWVGEFVYERCLYIPSLLHT